MYITCNKRETSRLEVSRHMGNYYGNCGDSSFSKQAKDLDISLKSGRASAHRLLFIVSYRLSSEVHKD